MRRSKLKLWAVVFAVLLAFSVVSIIAELFGLSVCFFGTPLHAWLALPFCVGSVGLTTCLVIWLKRRKRAGDRLLHTALQVVLCVLCTISVLVAVFAAVLTHISYSGSDVSGDGAHKAFLETDETSGEPTVHVYKRYSPFLVSYRNAATLYGFYGDTEEIVYVWEDTYCEVQYPGFSEDAESDADLGTLTRRIYYNVS